MVALAGHVSKKPIERNLGIIAMTSQDSISFSARRTTSASTVTKLMLSSQLTRRRQSRFAMSIHASLQSQLAALLYAYPLIEELKPSVVVALGKRS